jgi:hypothetical protein
VLDFEQDSENSKSKIARGNAPCIFVIVSFEKRIDDNSRSRNIAIESPENDLSDSPVLVIAEISPSIRSWALSTKATHLSSRR